MKAQTEITPAAKHPELAAALAELERYDGVIERTSERAESIYQTLVTKEPASLGDYSLEDRAAAALDGRVLPNRREEVAKELHAERDRENVLKRNRFTLENKLHLAQSAAGHEFVATHADRLQRMRDRIRDAARELVEASREAHAFLRDARIAGYHRLPPGGPLPELVEIPAFGIDGDALVNQIDAWVARQAK